MADSDRRRRKDLKELRLERMFETRSEEWERAGLSIEVSDRQARKARTQAIILLPLLIAVPILFNHHVELFGKDSGTIARIVAVCAFLALGWAFARAAGRAAAPVFLRRMDPATAGTVSFLVRLVAFAVTIFVALHLSGLQSQTVAIIGASAAVIIGLASQQTLGNVIAGTVLLTARPFRVGDRIRFQAGAIGGQIEGVVSSLGLLYTAVARGDDRLLIPNNMVLAAVVVPLREPNAIDVRVRLNAGIPPSRAQEILDAGISTPTRAPARVLLEEIDGDEVVVRVQATPRRAADGAALADEIIAALNSVTDEQALAKERS
jgi:small-conductance mechanosensitive channel